MFCSRCGANAAATASYCPNCGAQLAQQPAPVYAPPPSMPPSSPPPGGPQKRSNVAGVVAGILAAVLVMAVVGVGGFLLLRDDGASSATLADQTPSSPAATATTAGPAKKKPKRHASGPGDVRNLAAGLFCRDLMARGFSYAAATDYWRMHGQPNQMDADRNGIPCETVYPPTDVSAYWSERDLPPAALGSLPLPSGLFCRDLRARGLSYADAVSYWWQQGGPDRMDADLNGIPCETVYSSYEINGYW